MFQIVTDSTADLPKDYLREHGIGCLSLPYTIDGVTYTEENPLDWKEFYGKMRQGSMPTTSQVNPQEAEDALREYLGKNREILYLAFSSGLSGSYNSARMAADILNEEVEGAKIIVIDTLAASMGEGLMVYMAVKLREEGKSMEEVAAYMEAHKQNFVHVFTVDDLNHLHRGGRVSKTAAVFGTLAQIKPVLTVDKEGHLVVLDKIRGRKKSLMALVDLMEEKVGSYRDKNEVVFIGHGDCMEDAEFLVDKVKERFGIGNFLISNIGPTIGAHTGPGVVTLFFMGDSRE